MPVPLAQGQSHGSRDTTPVMSISGEAFFGPAQRSLVEAFVKNITRHVVKPKAGQFVSEEQPEVLLEN